MMSCQTAGKEEKSEENNGTPTSSFRVVFGKQLHEVFFLQLESFVNIHQRRRRIVQNTIDGIIGELHFVFFRRWQRLGEMLCIDFFQSGGDVVDVIILEL